MGGFAGAARLWAAPARSYFFAEVLELGVDHVALRILGTRAVTGRGLAALRLRGGLRLAVHHLGELVGGLRQRLLAALDAVEVVALESLARLGHRRLDRLLVLGRNLVAVVAKGPLGRVDQRVALVLDLDDVPALRVLGRVGLGLLLHPVDLVLREAGRSRDRDVLLLGRRLVARRDVQDTVRVDVECYLDLRHAARGRRDTVQVEAPERAVVPGHGPLALDHVHFDRRLAVRGRREGLGLLRRNRGVGLDEARHHAAEGLDAERQRRHVEEQEILDLTREHGRLNRGTYGHHLVRV